MITWAATQALKKTFPSEFAVLHFGAHCGFSEAPFDQGDGSTLLMRHIHQQGLSLFQVGQRSVQMSEIDYALENEIPVMMMQDIRRLGLEELISHLIYMLPQDVYITLHLDSLDPSIMPATRNPIPGGLPGMKFVKSYAR